jgi:hypothetical protein
LDVVPLDLYSSILQRTLARDITFSLEGYQSSKVNTGFYVARNTEGSRTFLAKWSDNGAVNDQWYGNHLLSFVVNGTFMNKVPFEFGYFPLAEVCNKIAPACNWGSQALAYHAIGIGTLPYSAKLQVLAWAWSAESKHPTEIDSSGCAVIKFTENG